MRMKHLASMMAGAFLLLVSPVASSASEIHPYSGIGTGWFGIEGRSDSIQYSQKSSTYGLFAYVGADVNEYFGFEARIGSTGKAKDTTVALSWPPRETKLQSPLFYGAYAKLQYPVTDGVTIYGLAGVTRGKYRFENGTFVNERTKSDFSYGGGVMIGTGSEFTLGIEWMQYWKNIVLDGFGSKGSMWGASLTATYHF